ncbi:MAG TPA: hypothetical protein DD471_13565, partial [Planctomycetes bacterium]|nr:hypothetical protein [Planctomycetota bacterium]
MLNSIFVAPSAARKRNRGERAPGNFGYFLYRSEDNMSPLNLRRVFYTLAILLFLCPAYCDEHAHPDGHEHGSTGQGHDDNSPLGVMGDHTYQADEVMLSYRYGIMEMNGNLDGSTTASTRDILDAGFMMAPTSMRMEM